MDFDHLRTFLEVSRNKSFSRAAEKLRLTQPSISAQIRSLERTLGHQLFDRGGGKVTLTGAGRVFEPYAEDTLSRQTHIQHLLSELERSPRGKVVISANDSTALYVLPHFFSAFRKHYSRVALSVVRAERVKTIKAVLDREADFGIVSLPVNDPRLQVELIHEDDLLLVAHPNHPLAAETPVTLETVAKHSLLLPAQGRRREMLNLLFSERNLVPRIGMELDSSELLKRLVLAEVGMGFLPGINILNELRQHQLVTIDIEGVRIARQLGLIFQKDRKHTRAGHVFFRVATGSPIKPD